MRECFVTPTLTSDDTPQSFTGSGESVGIETLNPDDIPDFPGFGDPEGICPIVQQQFYLFDGSFSFDNSISFGPN